jgi:hypothetical protein
MWRSALNFFNNGWFPKMDRLPNHEVHKDAQSFSNDKFLLCALRDLRGETLKCINIHTVTSSARKLSGGRIPDAGAKDVAGQAKR